MANPERATRHLPLSISRAVMSLFRLNTNNHITSMIIAGSLSIILYLISGALLLLKLNSQPLAAGLSRFQLLLPAVIAVLLHGWLVYQGLLTPQGLDIGFFSVLSLVGCLVVVLLLLATFSQPIESLGIFVFPVAALMLALRLFNPEGYYLAQDLGAGLEFHILSSILAYSLLSIAAVQAILLYIQDTHLHNKHPGGFIRALPPLDTMETLLFQMIGLGFLVLSISLLSGLSYLENILGQHLVHKTVLSVVAWFIFGILLFGRWRFGWRGRTAIRWTISGFIMLMLAYFGSKFVIELILQR
jgi:ABC-type uncharacterized transport system permease subunit